MNAVKDQVISTFQMRYFFFQKFLHFIINTDFHLEASMESIFICQGKDIKLRSILFFLSVKWKMPKPCMGFHSFHKHSFWVPTQFICGFAVYDSYPKCTLLRVAL